MSFKHLSDQELIASTNQALRVSRKAEVEVLRHFREIELRRLWTDAGSLYQYLSRTFHLTDDQIYPRLQAMRLMNAVPEVERKLEEGKLNITTALKAQQVFKAESKTRPVSIEEKREVILSLENVSTRRADKVLAEKYPLSQKPVEKVKPISPNQNLVQFYVDDEMLKEIEALKAKFSHQMPEGRMEDLMKILVRLANRKPEARKRITVKANSSFIRVKTRSRYISSEVKREMERVRHEGCSHVDSSGSKCGSTHFLQRDHIHEYRNGGTNELYNLRWLCGFHNRNRGETKRQDFTKILPRRM